MAQALKHVKILSIVNKSKTYYFSNRSLVILLLFYTTLVISIIYLTNCINCSNILGILKKDNLTLTFCFTPLMGMHFISPHLKRLQVALIYLQQLRKEW